MCFCLMEHSFGSSRFPAAALFISRGLCLSAEHRPSHVLCHYCVISSTRCCLLGPVTLCLLGGIILFLSLRLNSFFLVCLDIGSWLQLFGFQLHNVVPGFPKPDVGRLEQTYELMKTQTKTQNWDSSKVSPSTVLHDVAVLMMWCFFCFFYGRRYPELSNNLAGRRRALGLFCFFFSWQQTL